MLRVLAYGGDTETLRAQFAAMGELLAALDKAGGAGQVTSEISEALRLAPPGLRGSEEQAAEHGIVLSALRVVAARLDGNSSQLGRSENELNRAIRDWNTARRDQVN